MISYVSLKSKLYDIVYFRFLLVKASEISTSMKFTFAATQQKIEKYFIFTILKMKWNKITLHTFWRYSNLWIELIFSQDLLFMTILSLDFITNSIKNPRHVKKLSSANFAGVDKS